VAHDERAATSLRRSIGIELVLAAIVLAVTATLTTVTGP
jgi:putative copper export protein